MRHAFFKAMAAAFTAILCGSATAETSYWSGNGSNTLTSNPDNWWNGNTGTPDAMGFNGQGGKTATFDNFYEMPSGSYVWVGETDADTYVRIEEIVTNIVTEIETDDGVEYSSEEVTMVVTNAVPVVFESVDASNEYGLSCTGHFGIGDGDGQRGALLVKSGRYKSVGDIIVGTVNDDKVGDAIAFLTMQGGEMESDFWMAIGRHNTTNGSHVASYIDIANASVRLGCGASANGMIDFSGSGAFTVREGGYVTAPGSKNADSYGIALAIANQEDVTNEVSIVGGVVELGGSVCIGRNGSGTLTMDEPGNDKMNSSTRLVTTGITTGGDGTFNFIWGTLVAATSNYEFIESKVNWVIAGSPKISTAFPIYIPASMSAPEGGSVYFEVTATNGCVVLPTPANVQLFPVTGSNTKMIQLGGFTTFVHKDVFVWTDSSQIPAAGADVIVPAGAAVEFTPTAGNLELNSLRVDGTLTINHSDVEQAGKLLAGDVGLTVTGLGALAFPSSAIHLYEESAVIPEETITVQIVRTVSELLSMEEGDTLLVLGSGSQLAASQAKIAKSRRPAIVSYDDATHIITVTAGTLPPDWTSRVTEKGQVVWDTPVDITGASDISQEGEFVCGYFHNLSYGNSNRKPVVFDINGTTFTRYFAEIANEDHSMIDYSGVGYSWDSRYSRSGADISGLGTVATDAERALLGGCMKANQGNTGGAMDITLHGLTDGHAYLVQIFCMDSTAGAAPMYVSDTNEEERAEVRMNVGYPGAGTGQYVIGRFVADGETQTVRISASDGAVARENAILWRDITEDVVWGGEDGTWNSSGVNWVNYTQEYAIWTNRVVGFAHSAIIDTPSTLTVEGSVYAAAVTLSNGASLNVAGSRNELVIATDIIATTNAELHVQSGNAVELGGTIRMTGYGNLTLDAHDMTEVTIDAGTVTRTSASKPTHVTFSDTPLYGDAGAREYGYHALYCEEANVALPLDNFTGHGQLSALNQTIAITNSHDSVFAGGFIAGTLIKSGNGNLRYFGRTSGSSVSTVRIDGGTLTLATPYDIDGMLYDCDATKTDTIQLSSDGKVTRWDDANGSGFYLAPKAEDTNISATYVAPELDEDAFDGRPGLASESFRMDGSAVEYQSSVFAVMKLTGDSVGSPRLLVDASELGMAATKPYRLHVSINGDTIRYYNINGAEDAYGTQFVAVNGIYGTNYTFSVDSPVLVSAPWHWTRDTGANSNYGNRIIAYGWGAAMAWGEVISYTRALTVEEKLAIEDYLMRKWGITNEAYKPFGDADLVIGANGVFDAGNQAITVKSLVVNGTLKGAANITVTGDVTFNSGSKLYIDAADAVNGVLYVGGETHGGNNVSIYSMNSAGQYTATKRYGLKQDAASHRLFFSRTGFNIRIK